MDTNKQLINSFIKQSVHPTWFDVLSNMQSLHEAILKVVPLQNYTPGLNDMLNAFKYCPLDKLSCVMLFQDPYPQAGVATGIATGNKPNTELSPSLEIIKEELGELDDPSLITWANQGVLLLNCALTCEVNKVGSHYDIWQQFMVDLFKILSQRQLVYALFGSKAKSFQFCIKNGLVLKFYHPAADLHNGQRLFRGSGCFDKIDNALASHSRSIKWNNKVVV